MTVRDCSSTWMGKVEGGLAPLHCSGLGGDRMLHWGGKGGAPEDLIFVLCGQKEMSDGKSRTVS